MTEAKVLDLSQVSSSQIGMMRHALGLNYKPKPKRNYYYSSSESVKKEWLDLVEKGFASGGPGWNETDAYFWVTFEAAKLLCTVPMSLKYFKAL